MPACSTSRTMNCPLVTDCSSTRRYSRPTSTSARPIGCRSRSNRTSAAHCCRRSLTSWTSIPKYSSARMEPSNRKQRCATNSRTLARSSWCFRCSRRLTKCAYGARTWSILMNAAASAAVGSAPLVMKRPAGCWCRSNAAQPERAAYRGTRMRPHAALPPHAASQRQRRYAGILQGAAGAPLVYAVRLAVVALGAGGGRRRALAAATHRRRAAKAPHRTAATRRRSGSRRSLRNRASPRRTAGRRLKHGAWGSVKNLCAHNFFAHPRRSAYMTAKSGHAGRRLVV